MPDRLAKLVVEIQANADQFHRDMRAVSDGMGKIGISAKGLATAFAGVSAASVGIGLLAKKVFELGSSVGETQSKFDTVFGELSGQVGAFADQYGTMAGLVRSETMDLLATTAAMVQGMGYAKDESAAFATEALKLAGDLGSFNNLPTAEVMNAIRSATVGEREQLKQLGIVLREVDVQQRAMLNTGKQTAAALTDQEKATATLQLISERAGVAVGDLARTSDSAANQYKRIQATFKNIAEDFATDMLPILSELLPSFEQLADAATTFAGKAASGLQTVTDMLELTNYTYRAEVAGINAMGDNIELVEAKAASLREEMQRLAIQSVEEDVHPAFKWVEKLTGMFSAVGDTAAEEALDIEYNFMGVALALQYAEQKAESLRAALADQRLTWHLDAPTLAKETILEPIQSVAEMLDEAMKGLPDKVVYPLASVDQLLNAAIMHQRAGLTQINTDAKAGLDEWGVAWARGIENVQDATANFIKDTASDFLGLFHKMENDTRSQLERIADLFANFADRIANIMLEIAAQRAASRLMQWLGVGVEVGTAAQGGVVGSIMPTKMVDPSVFAGAPHFSRGGIVGDEVPIIAHRGETIIPKGQAGSGTTVNQSNTVNIYAWDSQSLYEFVRRNRQLFAGSVIEAVQDSPALVRTMRRM